MLPVYFDWNTGMIFGASFAASDPVSVLAGVKVTSADSRLIAFTSVDIIMNDGCGDLLFTPFFGAVFEDGTIHAGELVLSTAQNKHGDATLGVWSPLRLRAGAEAMLLLLGRFAGV